MSDNRNTILAVVLSGLVLLGWQYFFNIPQMEKQRAAQQAQQLQQQAAKPQDGTAPAATTPASPGAPSAAAPSSPQPTA
ncbi:MAG: membrane protein insertase YidC, partial [Rhodopseudomonas sp.]